MARRYSRNRTTSYRHTTVAAPTQRGWKASIEMGNSIPFVSAVDTKTKTVDVGRLVSDGSSVVAGFVLASLLRSSAEKKVFGETAKEGSESRDVSLNVFERAAVFF